MFSSSRVAAHRLRHPALNGRLAFRTPLALALAMTLAAGSLAGPLSPAAGPVASTMKTISEVEPRIAINQQNTPGDATNEFIINAPGSYYLTGMTGIGSGKNGIKINASHVTIDLNGYTLFGYAGSLDGITTDITFRVAITVRNGIIRTFGGDGVDIDTLSPTVTQSAVFDRLHVADNAGFGIRANDGIAIDSQFNNNASTGLSLGAFFANVIRGCSANGNGADGFFTRSATITNCSATDNADEGFTITTGTISNSVAVGNATGFFVSPGTISGCTASNNNVGIQASGLVKDNVVERPSAAVGSIGILINSERTRVEGNHIVRCATGVQSTQASCLIVSNSFSGVGTAMNIIAGSRVGAIVTPVASGAINGNTGGGLGLTDPTANIIH